MLLVKICIIITMKERRLNIVLTSQDDGLILNAMMIPYAEDDEFASNNLSIC